MSGCRRRRKMLAGDGGGVLEWSNMLHELEARASSERMTPRQEKKPRNGRMRSYDAVAGGQGVRTMDGRAGRVRVREGQRCALGRREQAPARPTRLGLRLGPWLRRDQFRFPSPSCLPVRLVCLRTACGHVGRDGCMIWAPTPACDRSTIDC